MHADPVVAARGRVDVAIADLPATARLAISEEVGPALTVASATEVLRAMLRSRELDAAARTMRARGDGYYTIASAGHEANALLGRLLRPTDPCLLHYRSGALLCARIAADGRDPVDPTVRSFAAAASDPVAQGRHKVWGDPATWVLPQTSTIASHVPKAAGLAFALASGRRAGTTNLPADAVVCCSVGDASINHASALAGITSARYAHRRGRACPLLLVVEDNGIGISTGTPTGWVEASLGQLPGLRFVDADGALDQQAEWVAEAIDHCRRSRGPVVLRLATVRLWGHAGSDVEAAYRSRDVIVADEARDPLPAAIRRLGELGALGRGDARELVHGVRIEVEAAVERVRAPEVLPDADAVLAPLRPTRAAVEVRRRMGERGADGSGPQLDAAAARAERGTLAAHLNATLHETLVLRTGALVLGEDVARKGGVYGVTAGLLDAFGGDRVVDTLLDETTVLGVAQGAALAGLLPIPEIQYLAYVHNALDQLRGEACSTGFFSGGAIRTPMVVRIASFAYQRGFGGHFHNDDAIGALRDIPGLVVVAPSTSADGARVLRGAVGLAGEAGTVVALLEPIALYHERDLLEPGDGGWLEPPTSPDDLVLPGEVAVHDPPGGGAADVVVVTYANGVRMSRRVAARLAGEGIAVQVLDVRWLSPLPTEALRTAAGAVGRVLVADECRATGGGIADAVVADLVEGDVACRMRTVRSADSYVPLGPAADHVLLGEADIEAGVRDLVARPAPPRG